MALHPEQPRTDDQLVDELVARLFEHLEADEGDRFGQRQLPDELREELVAAGAPMTQALIAILEDEELGMADAPGEGWIAIWAARLLAERGDEQAVEPMVELLSDCHWDTWLHGALVSAIPTFGEVALEPTLRALEAAEQSGEDPEDEQGFRGALREVLARLGVHDDRIYDRLVAFLREDTELGASYLAIYGDERALEPLSQALDEAPVDESTGLGANHHLVELSEAIYGLGGDLTDSQESKLRRAEAIDEETRRRSHPLFGALKGPGPATYKKGPMEDVGRNDPCPCGSGKKYKKCCLRR
ncbi:MAG: SEC-C metal-binding domain-containing protein [Persicimonas sp.]